MIISDQEKLGRMRMFLHDMAEDYLAWVAKETEEGTNIHGSTVQYHKAIVNLFDELGFDDFYKITENSK